MTDLRKAATQVTPQVTPQVTGDVDETAKGEHNPEYDFFPWSMKPPPMKQWVGLTEDDFYGQSESQVMAMKYAEAKLKEKNT